MVRLKGWWIWGKDRVAYVANLLNFCTFAPDNKKEENLWIQCKKCGAVDMKSRKCSLLMALLRLSAMANGVL